MVIVKIKTTRSYYFLPLNLRQKFETDKLNIEVGIRSQTFQPPASDRVIWQYLFKMYTPFCFSKSTSSSLFQRNIQEGIRRREWGCSLFLIALNWKLARSMNRGPIKIWHVHIENSGTKMRQIYVTWQNNSGHI